MIGMAPSTTGRQPRARHHHHGAGADEQHEIAQGHRHRRADRGLDLRGVGGEPRDHLAGLGLVEKVGGERGEMGEHVAAQIGDDTLAERGDQEVARRARQRQQRRDGDHHQKVAVDQLDAARGEAEVDHAPHRDRHDQRGQRRHDQRAERGERPAAVAVDVGQKRGERPQIGLALFGRLGHSRSDRDRLFGRCRGRRWRRPLQRCRIVIGREVHAPQCLFAARRRFAAGQCPLRGALATYASGPSVRLSRRGLSRYRPAKFLNTDKPVPKP